MTTKSPYVIDVTDQTFATEVLERSKTTPVVVDFWAEWCGPCRMLGPILERLADEFEGVFILAKVDVDQNPRVSRQYFVQGIPAVKAFYNEDIVGEFTGAQPEPRVQEFLQKLVPTQADTLAKQAYQWEISEQFNMAETNYQAALDDQADHYPAMIGLARVLLKQDKLDESLTILNDIPAGLPERANADAIVAMVQFKQESQGNNETILRTDIKNNTNNIDSRYRLACLLAVEQRYSEALDEFLDIVRCNRHYQNDGAKKAMLAIFTIIGETHDLTQTYRRKLANALF